MAIREIKATLALDGEKKFKAGLDDASRSLRVMDTGLKAIEASYGNTGDRSTMLAKKSEVLKQELEQQKSIVSALSGAVQESAKKYGDTAKQTDGYRIKLNNALKKQAEMEKAIRETQRELDDLGKESVSVGREIEQGVGDAAEEAGKSLKGMYENLKGDIDVLKGSAVASVVADVGGFVVDAVSGVMDFVESNREYRGQQAFTEQQIRDAGLELQNTMGLIYEAASFTGDLDGAREALSNLLGVGFTLEELQEVLANLTGLHIRNPESFRLETTAESLRETVQQAEATGVFADYLMSLSDVLGKPAERIIEEFNKAMEVAEDLDERQAVAMHFLGQSGGIETKTDFAEREKELIEARAAQIELTNAWAELSEELEPVVTALVKGAATVVGGLADAVETVKGFFAEEQMTPEEIEEMQEEMQKHVKDLMVERRNVALQYQNELPKLTESKDFEISFTPAITNAAEDGTAVGNTFIESVEQGMDEAEPGLSSAAETVGKNAAIAAGNGINAEAPFAISAAAALADGINAELSRIMPVSNLTAGLYDRVSTGGGNRTTSAYGSGGVGPITIPLNIDGRKVGEAVIPTVSAGIGEQIKQAVSIG